MINTRLKAFATHLLLSALILIALLAIILFFWYPGELIHAGATTGLSIIVSVDLVLGPLLTLVVFNINKKSLKFDLAVIGLVQISSLAFGMWLVYNERPIAQVLADDGIHLVTKADLDLYEIAFKSNTTGVRPAAYMLELPDDWSKVPEVKLMTEMVEGKPMTYREDLFMSFSNVTDDDFDKRIENIWTSPRRNELERAETESLVDDETCEWVPVVSMHVGGTACINLKAGIIRLSDHKGLFPF